MGTPAAGQLCVVWGTGPGELRDDELPLFAKDPRRGHSVQPDPAPRESGPARLHSGCLAMGGGDPFPW